MGEEVVNCYVIAGDITTLNNSHQPIRKAPAGCRLALHVPHGLAKSPLRNHARMACARLTELMEWERAGRSKNAMNSLTMMTYRRKIWLRQAPERYRMSSSRAPFIKLLLSIALIVSAVATSAQEVWSGGRILPGALPPIIVVASSPSLPPASVSPQSRPSVTVKIAENPEPSIIWHRVHGRWHWHCVADCAKYRGYLESPGNELKEFYDSGSH